MSASASSSPLPVARGSFAQPFEGAGLKGRTVQLGEARYVLERLLGAGGMGEVYVAVRVMGDESMEWCAAERVAVKVVRRELAALVGANAKPFVDEAELHLMLDHPNIVRVRGLVEQDETLYLVMDYLEGRDLRTLLKLAASNDLLLSEAVICNIFAQVADALDYVHRATDPEGQPLHIVHRDVSPSNIRVTDSGEVKLMDFGVAWSTQENRLATRSSERVYKGKLTYLSPEQANHQPLDGRSDLFALGCVLVEALTGIQPFEVGHDLLVLNAIRTVSPGLVEQATPGVAPELKAICHKLLALQPADRYATGQEVAAALRAYAFRRGYLLDSATLATEMMKLDELPAMRPELGFATATRRPSAVATGALIFIIASVALAFAHFWRPPPPVPVEYVPMPALKPATPLPHEPPPPPPKKPLVGAAKKCAVAGALLAASACPIRIPTTPRAGDCPVVPVKEVQGERLPEVLPVEFISLNGEGCTGRDRDSWPEEPWEPCPVGNGTILVQVWDHRHGAISKFLLVGRARVIPGKETLHERLGESHEATGRMMALFTELRLPNGSGSFPICGALFEANEASVKDPVEDLGMEGVPVLDAKYYNHPSLSLGYLKVKLFWPK